MFSVVQVAFYLIARSARNVNLVVNLGLELHEGKTKIADVRRGVEFLGAYVKPGRTYVARQTLSRMERHLVRLHERVLRGEVTDDELRCSLSSFGGVLGHYSSFRIREALFASLPAFHENGGFDDALLKWAAYDE